mgnify:CR=1 FL=1
MNQKKRGGRNKKRRLGIISLTPSLKVGQLVLLSGAVGCKDIVKCLKHNAGQSIFALFN